MTLTQEGSARFWSLRTEWEIVKKDEKKKKDLLSPGTCALHLFTAANDGAVL
jgi:hypothetical protein